MKILFRTDASIQIGSGHVMRCLTFADQLKREGHECVFICRAHDGHLGNLIGKRGHELKLLSFDGVGNNVDSLSEHNPHSNWLGVSPSFDFKQCQEILFSESVDWLVIDHYALDVIWEESARQFVKKIIVIDDLADRKHNCDVLIDQTFGREDADYRDYVPAFTTILCGSEYSLLRPEFAQWRRYSLARRRDFPLNNILVNLGGVDKDNVTCAVLSALGSSAIPPSCKVTIVMGKTAPWTALVRKVAESMSFSCEVKVDVNNMGQIMSDADLAIGAAGSTSWERCAVGLPSIQIVIAKNQRLIAQLLADEGASKILNSIEKLPELINSANEWMPSVSYKARHVTDGRGLERVLCRIKENR